MEKIQKAAAALSEELLTKGYERFNIKDVCVGEDFKTAIENYMHYANNVLKARDAFPLEVVTRLTSKMVGNPEYVARFRIFGDAKQGLSIGSMEMNLYHEGMAKPLASINLNVKSPEHIPHGEQFKKMIDAKWNKIYTENKKNWKKPQPQTNGGCRNVRALPGIRPTRSKDRYGDDFFVSFMWCFTSIGSGQKEYINSNGKKRGEITELMITDY